MTHAMFRALALLPLVLAPTLPAQELIRDYPGASTNEFFGVHVANAGDVNADGVADIIVGAASDSSNYSRIYSGLDGTLIRTVTGPAGVYTGGWRADGVGDLNFDGHGEYAIGASHDPVLGPAGGAVRVYDGATGAVRWSHFGETDEVLGRSVAGIGDLDGDGVPDVLAGSPGDPPFIYPPTTQVFAYSGATGAPIFELTGPNHDGFGFAVGAAGDVDADGTVDFLAGAPQDDTMGSDAGKVMVVSGADASVLRTLYAMGSKDYFGVSVASPGDVDEDGFADHFIGAYELGDGAGYARLFSGQTGSPIFLFSGQKPGDQLGRSVAGAGDVDGDGVIDLAAGAPEVGDLFTPAGAGYVDVYSGASGVRIARLRGDELYSGFGLSIAGAGDVTFDGVPEIVAGARLASPAGMWSGKAQVWSPIDPRLAATPGAISVASGGVQAFDLDSGAPHAGKAYLLLGSASGFLPGVGAGSEVLPLNLDAWLVHTLANPNAPPLSGSLGLLDAAGSAAASLTVPTGLPSATVGLVLHHAYLVLGTGAGTVDQTSNPVRLELLP